MSGAIPPLPQYAFMAWCSVKAQGQLYLYFILTTRCIWDDNIKITSMADNIKMGLKENGVNVRLDSSGLGYRPEAGS
jgi:hypothetical protein